MIKRLVITGLPCPAERWESFLGASPRQRIIPIREVFENCPNSVDPRVLSQYITEQIEREQPSSIVCHDLGVPLTLLSLLRLKRLGRLPKTKLTLFNGVFRKVSLWKAAQPLKIQVTPMWRMIREVEDQGGSVDMRLRPFVPQIRAMYRLIILYRFSEKMTSLLGMDDFAGFPPKSRLKTPVQIIASTNDPYIPLESLKQLRRDVATQRFIEMEYGHFPYSIDPATVLPYIEEFEQNQ